MPTTRHSKLWIEAMDRIGIELKGTHLCSLHFAPKDMWCNPQMFKRPRLYRSAVPSIPVIKSESNCIFIETVTNDDEGDIERVSQPASPSSLPKIIQPNPVHRSDIMDMEFECSDEVNQYVNVPQKPLHTIKR